MFKKPLSDAKTSAPLRSSERRKLRARTAERFQLAPEVADSLVPDGLLSQKFSAYNDEPGVLYLSGDGNPLWFSVGKDSDELIPTVYALWKHRTLLPVLTTSATVVQFLVGGADLMIPGVVQAPADATAGALVAVAQSTHNARGPPLAVGRMAIDADKIDRGVTKGKAVIVLHTWKDHLWAIGPKGQPPEAASASETGGDKAAAAAADDDDDDRTTRMEAETVEDRPAAAKDGPVAEAEEGRLTPEEVSARLRSALLQALRTTLAGLPSSAFPMPTTTLAFTRTATTPVDVKHSTFKSLSSFLRTAEKGGLLRLKDARPDAVVVAVYPTHADVVAHAPHRTVGEEDERKRRAEEREAQQSAAAADAEKRMTVTELWKPHLGTLPLFGDLGLDTGALYTLAEVKSALLAYVEKHELVNRVEQQYLNVGADAVFSAALYGPPNTKGAKPVPEFAKREDALGALCSRMQPWHRIAIGGDEAFTETRKGAPRPITVAVKSRQGKKICTFITGFEPYHLSADALTGALRVRCASSTSISPVPGGGKEVMVQGKQTSVVLELLGSMGVPKEWVEVSKAAAVKKK
ncbi:hypothetical protein F5148DRAFT_1277436 [Russula earlei]|uniref:Uncharacterized protein n=1 Tax=Russula earlei TaxID=71964 RepID=A0ACC0U0Q2_9AGAM|nr:hypothetical protein F5148DRAFT_1277436 [Russula earlei]